MREDKLRGTFFVMLCVALWALIPVVAKLGQSALDNHQFLFWSSMISFLVIFATVLMTRNLHHLLEYQLKDWLRFSFLGLLGTYIYYLFLYLGYSQATGMEVLVIQYTWPIMIVLFSITILKERLTLRKCVAVVLGFGGVIVVLSKGDFEQIHIDNPLVIVLVGAGSACFALFSVLSKNNSKEPLGVVSVYFLVATISSLGSMLLFSEMAYPSAADLVPILLNGTLVNGFSYVFWILALRSTDATFLVPFTFITPILSAIYLILFFEEPFVPVYGIGLMMVVAGGLANSLNFKRNIHQESNH